jgi:outer membrane lipoprotein SlyB
MGRFFAFLFTFILGGIIGFAVGGLGGAAAGGYLGACKVVDSAVGGGTITQDQANTLVKSIANDIEIKPEQKAKIVERLKKANQPPSPCMTAIEAL